MNNATLHATINDFNALPLELCSIIYEYAYNPLEAVFQEMKTKQREYIVIDDLPSREHDLNLYELTVYVNVRPTSTKRALNCVYTVIHYDNDPMAGDYVPCIDRRRILN